MVISILKKQLTIWLRMNKKTNLFVTKKKQKNIKKSIIFVYKKKQVREQYLTFVWLEWYKISRNQNLWSDLFDLYWIKVLKSISIYQW